MQSRWLKHLVDAVGLGNDFVFFKRLDSGWKRQPGLHSQGDLRLSSNSASMPSCLLLSVSVPVILSLSIFFLILQTIEYVSCFFLGDMIILGMRGEAQSDIYWANTEEGE